MTDIDIVATLIVGVIIYFGCRIAGRAFANEYKKGVHDGMLEFAKQLREHDLYIDMMISHEGGTKEVRLTAKKDQTQYHEDNLTK